VAHNSSGVLVAEGGQEVLHEQRVHLVQVCMGCGKEGTCQYVGLSANKCKEA
jgi:hypothetical protein